MWQQSEQDGIEEIFLAGEKVMPGIYRQVGGSRVVRLDREDVLPASLDGRVACYTKIRYLWSQIGREWSSRMMSSVGEAS